MKPHELMLTSILDCRRIDLYVEQIILTPPQQREYDEMLARYQAGEPLQYIIGFTEFCGHRIEVNEDVLIPRPETELLVEGVWKAFKAQFNQSLKFCDLGTGSGNIAIALAKAFPKCVVQAVDVTAKALEVARRNAADHGVSERINFIEMDMFAYLMNEGPDQYFDCVVSNPPYIKELDMLDLPADVRQEPSLALEAGEDGLKFYKMISAAVDRVMALGGQLFLELGDHQAEGVSALFNGKQNFSDPEFIQDYVQTKRILQIQKNSNRTLAGQI